MVTRKREGHDGSTGVSGRDGERDATTLTRRSMLAASAAGVSGIVTGAHELEGGVGGVRSRSASLDGTGLPAQTTAEEWSQTATLTAEDAMSKARFGYSIAVDGDRAIVGADTDNENGSKAGAAYVFALDDDRWVQEQKLVAADGSSGDRFGDVVALDEGRALVGARRSDSRAPGAGAAYVFEVTDDGWRQTQKLVSADAGENDRFGRGLALDGPRAFIGARRNDEAAKDAGAVYVFELEDENWVQIQKLAAEDADPDDRFGRAVTLDASRALVGTRLDDGAASDAGAVYVFELIDGAWRQTQKLTAADANEGDRFGGSVSLGGDRALVGADRDDETAEDGGAVYTFRFQEGEWRQKQKLTADDPGPGTRFGSTIARQRQIALVGAEHDSENGESAGAVFTFQREENRWRQTHKLTAPDPESKDRFGSSVVLDGNRAFVGAMNDGTAVEKGGAVYVFTREGGVGGGSPFVTSPLGLVALGGVLAIVTTVLAVFTDSLSRLAAPIRGLAANEPPSELLSDEERVLRHLEDNGGRVKQQDLTDALDWSQTKTSNVVNDLQDEGKIEVYRIGNENTLALPGEMEV